MKYDIIISWDDDDECVIKSRTKEGIKFLKTLFEDYQSGNEAIMHLDPEDFGQIVPTNLKVGCINPQSKKVFPFAKNPLH